MLNKVFICHVAEGFNVLNAISAHLREKKLEKENNTVNSVLNLFFNVSRGKEGFKKIQF